MIALTAMTIQIIDNNPDGIRICRVDGESLVTVVVPRDMLSEAKSLPRFAGSRCVIIFLMRSWSSEPCVCGTNHEGA